MNALNRYVAKMSAPTPACPLMQKVRFFMIAFLLSNLGLLVVRLVPNFFPGKNNPWNGSVSYWVMAVIYVGLIIKFRLPTLKFFKLPLLDWKTLVGLTVAIGIAIQRVHPSDLQNKSLMGIITGAVFILTIGIAEEIVSRGFVYGIFERLGKNFALVFSSVLFGLLHLGWYLGPYWDPWPAYWHVFNAFAAGFFLCSLMIVTQSIWPSIVMHAAWDWRLGFNPESVALPKAGHITYSEFWSGLISPIWNNLPFFLIGVALVSIRHWKAPAGFEKLLLKFKLIEVD